ncbi:hypothetical protein JTB14_035996 [Gonioctena quinquepunctata]|nr:hypothetical protein JTB14_035996 [Gonioctena quinquepunctata]
MDQQKKHRKVLRAAFTKNANELDELLSEEIALQQVQVAWEVLLQKHENLLIANEEIYDTLLQENVSEEDLMLEIDCCEGYEKKFIDLRITYGHRQKHVDIGLDEDDRRSRASLAVSKSTLGPGMRKFKLPPIEFKKIGVEKKNGGANPESSTMSRLESLMSFVKSEVENEERVSLAAEGFGLNSEDLVSGILQALQKKHKLDPNLQLLEQKKISDLFFHMIPVVIFKKYPDSFLTK